MTYDKVTPLEKHAEHHGCGDHTCGHDHGHDHSKVPYKRAEKVGRNDPCPCLSGRKYKKCCLGV